MWPWPERSAPLVAGFSNHPRGGSITGIASAPTWRVSASA